MKQKKKGDFVLVSVNDEVYRCSLSKSCGSYCARCPRALDLRDGIRVAVGKRSAATSFCASLIFAPDGGSSVAECSKIMTFDLKVGVGGHCVTFGSIFPLDEDFVQRVHQDATNLIDKVRDKGGGGHYGYSWMAVSALEKEETFLKWERKLLPMP